MERIDAYEDLDGDVISLAGLDAEERQLIARLRRRARTNPDWNDFDNYWTAVVPAFYRARGLPRKAVPQTMPWRIAQDLSSRLGIAAGLVRPDDYRSELEDLIRENFPTCRAFCEATGLSEDMLSHVLAGRKDLSLAALTKALERIGYRLRIVPAPKLKKQVRVQKQTG
jgi:hypothetical protein